MAARAERPTPLDARAVDRALEAWREHDDARAIHPADRAAIRATDAPRALVLELFERPPRDLYNACAQLGRLLAEAGASPSLAVATIDGAGRALAAAGVGCDEARLSNARASVAEGYLAAVRETEREIATRAWDYPACVVPLDAETVAIAAGCPADDRDRLADWAGRVAAKVSKRGARTAIVSGSGAAKREIEEALRLIGIEVKGELATRRWRLPWQR